MSLDAQLPQKQETKVTGISMSVEDFNKLERIVEHYGTQRSPIVAAMIRNEYERLVKARKIKKVK